MECIHAGTARPRRPPLSGHSCYHTFGIASPISMVENLATSTFTSAIFAVCSRTAEPGMND
jgi:hypothetical protein